LITMQCAEQATPNAANERSSLLPSGAPNVQVYTYVENSSDPAHQLNVFTASLEVSNQMPPVLHVHGGGWRRGSKEHKFYGAPDMGRFLATAGFTTLTPSYRLRYPEAAADVAQAISWTLKTFFETHKVKAKGILLSGHSAGAHLISLVLLHPQYLENVNVRREQILGVVGISGIYSLRDPMTPSALLHTEQCRGFISSVFYFLYVSPVFGSDQAALLEASPIHHLSSSAADIRHVPFLLLNARFDFGLQHGSSSFADALKARGIQVHHRQRNTGNHANITRDAEVVAEIVEWIHTVVQ